jgi:hypothetical protein
MLYANSASNVSYVLELSFRGPGLKRTKLAAANPQNYCNTRAINCSLVDQLYDDVPTLKSTQSALTR